MKRGRSSATTDTPSLSVILPVYNAMPWLPISVRDMLKQRLEDDAPLEVVQFIRLLHRLLHNQRIYHFQLPTAAGFDGAIFVIQKPFAFLAHKMQPRREHRQVGMCLDAMSTGKHERSQFSVGLPMAPVGGIRLGASNASKLFGPVLACRTAPPLLPRTSASPAQAMVGR